MIGVMIPSAFAESVPDWVKNTAGWWATDQISETEFVNAVEFLVKESIIQVNVSQTSETSDGVPDWVKNTAGWWATDQISETEFVNAIKFLIESGIINISSYNCDQSEDRDRNGVPDLIETAPVLSGHSSDEAREMGHRFENKNWSNCYFPKDLSHYVFYNVDLSYSDFSDAKLFNTMFDRSNLQGADLSNVDIRGSVFFQSNLSHTNFENADFSTDNWEEPFVIFSYDNYPQLHPNTEKDYVCYYKPCGVRINFLDYDLNNNFYAATFGKNWYPLNLGFVDDVFDESDRRSIWRHHAGFYFSNITGTIFTGSDLSYANIWGSLIRNADFTDVNLNNGYFRNVDFNNVKSTSNLLSGTVGDEGMRYPANTELDTADQYISNKKFETLRNLDGDDFNIVFDHALDYPPINWSMGMTIYDEKLYVADTDNHRIIVYDLENNEKLLTFTSPMQNHCDSTHTWTKAATDCTNDMRNLPTSIKIIDEKIFVAYGFQDEIQVFDLDGNYLWKFGSSGTQTGQFNLPHRLAASNNELFVADLENYRIQVFDLDGNFIRQFETHSNSIKQFSKPIDVYAYDSQVFVVDQNHALILVFDLNGKLMKEFPVNQNLSDTSEPYGIFVYDDLIFVSDIGDHSVKIFDLDGNFVKQFGQYGDRYGEFKHPNLAITDGNRIFVSDAHNYRIQIFNIVP
jgi:uncharacterized protein YjbI with pentapeptide repeats